jgi:hypothetical protein
MGLLRQRLGRRRDTARPGVIGCEALGIQVVEPGNCVKYLTACTAPDHAATGAQLLRGYAKQRIAVRAAGRQRHRSGCAPPGKGDPAFVFAYHLEPQPRIG